VVAHPEPVADRSRGVDPIQILPNAILFVGPHGRPSFLLQVAGVGVCLALAVAAVRPLTAADAPRSVRS
jgi:hypothetical protein